MPSTAIALRLARLLECKVEDLFELASPPTIEAAVAPCGAEEPRRAGRVAVGRCGARWVAHQLSDDAGTTADGVIVERPHSEVASIEPLSDLDDWEKNVLVAGCAPLLGAFATRASRRYRDARATWLSASSQRALALLRDELVHVAGLHVAETAARDAEGSVARVREQLPGRSVSIINLTRWRQGLVVPAGNPERILEPFDLLRSDLRVVRREPGSGADSLMRRLLGSDASRLIALRPGPQAFGHTQVAQLVRSGAADAGIAIEGAALAAGLDFVPLSEERFDLVVPQALVGEGPTARVLDLLTESGFQREASSLPGYDGSLAGQVTRLDPRGESGSARLTPRV